MIIQTCSNSQGDTRISNNLQHTTNSGDQSQHISVINLWKVNTFTHLEV